MKENATLAKFLLGRDGGTSAGWLERVGGSARNLWCRVLKIGQRQPRSLRLCESLSLGDRRFIAVVEYGRSRFLLGGTSGSLVLLADLNRAAPSEPGPVTPSAIPELEAGR